MITILRRLSSDVHIAVGEKDNAKAAWDTIAMQSMGASQVHVANAQKLRHDFEGTTFRDGETIDEFLLCLSFIITNLRALRDMLEESKLVAKFLRVVPPQLVHVAVAVAIEALLDVSTLSLDEVTRRLHVVQDHLDDTGDRGSNQGGCMILTK